MTPAAHKTAAETALTAAIAPRTGYALGPSDTDWIIIEANANLALATGAGTHYADAETALAAISTSSNQPQLTRDLLARTALGHALLADR